MTKTCEIYNSKFETKSFTRIYFYKCSRESTRSNYNTRKHQKNVKKKYEITGNKIIRRKMFYLWL